jgi:protein SCO1
MRRPHYLIGALAGCILLAGLAAAAILLRPGAGTQTGDVRIGGPFTLVDGSGKTVTDKDFRGRFMLVYFGYTHCPDVCPTTLSDMGSALDRMPKAARARVAPLFITVDPARDVPAVMGDYAHAFGPDFVGLTGSDAQVAAVEQEYHVYAAKHPLAHGDYGMDHSSIMYVMGPDGGFLGVISDGAKPGEIAERLLAFGA